MNLDGFSLFKQLDPKDTLGHIDGLPDQLGSARGLSQTQPLEFADGLRPSANDIRQVIICGMGGSAIGASLGTPYFATECTFKRLGLDESLRSNVTMGYYEAGHMMYTHTPSLAEIKRDLAEFIRWAMPS